LKKIPGRAAATFDYTPLRMGLAVTADRPAKQSVSYFLSVVEKLKRQEEQTATMLDVAKRSPL